MSPLDKAIRLYRIDAIIAFALAAIVVGIGLYTRNVLGIILCLVVAAVPAMPGFAALMVVKGLRTGNADKVFRGVQALRKLLYFTFLGIGGGLAAAVRLLLDEFKPTTLIGALIPVGLLIGVAVLLRYSFRVLDHPQIQERLVPRPQQETHPS
jgi:uncharacterized membrane-anchored protein